MEVRHDLNAHRFELPLDGSSAVLEYQLADGVMIATHTEVPPALRGRGLAEVITRAALDWAKKENLKVVPHCSYVARFFGKNPEYQPLRAN